MKIIFANGKEFPYIRAEETSVQYDNASRRMLHLQMDVEQVDFVQLREATASSENTALIHLVNEDENKESWWENYQIRKILAVQEMPVGKDEDGRIIRGDRIVLELCKKTYAEIQVDAQKAALEEMDAQITYTAMMTDSLL